MDIFTYGVTTSRYISSLVWQDDKLITSVGSNLGIWDLNSLSRERVIQYNTNVVMALIQNSEFIFSIAYSGEICVLDKKSLNLVTRAKSDGRCVRHASVNNNYLAVTAEEGPNNCKGVTVVFSLESLQKEEKNLDKVFTLEGPYRFCHVLEGGKLFIARKNVINEQERQQWRELKKDDEKISKDSKPKKKANYTILLYDIESKVEEKNKLIEHISTITSSTSNNLDLINLLYLDRQLVLLNPITFELIVNTQIAGSGAILASTQIERSTFISPKPGILYEMKADLVKNFPKVLDADKEQIESVIVRKLPGSGIDNRMFCFLLQDKEKGIVCNEDGISLVDFSTKKVKSASCFNITCCGLALSNNAELIACGDFSGNIMIFPSSPMISVEPVMKTFIMESVRTLTFDSKDQSIIAGTLSGKLLRSWLQDFSEPRPIATFEHGILNIHYNYHDDGNQYLVVGLSDGMFAILKEVELEHNMHFILGYYAHLPSSLPHNPDFGSLHKFAEIWSTVWSPTSNKYLVTASEDQTCCVWDISQKNAKLANKLTGHTRAVTSIDWKLMSTDLGEIFISCSDDQTARVYDPNNDFKLLFTFSTSFIKEWHTLTYLSLEKNGTRVAIGAQNGFLFIYNLRDKEFLFAERIHNGSVEGLDWKGDTVVTCSADNSVAIVNVSQSQQLMIKK